jgi:hypothetical protein
VTAAHFAVKLIYVKEIEFGAVTLHPFSFSRRRKAKSFLLSLLDCFPYSKEALFADQKPPLGSQIRTQDKNNTLEYWKPGARKSQASMPAHPLSL